MSKFRHWMFIPILVSVFTSIGLWIVYILALQHKMICWLSLPEGNAADKPPASCVFGLVMNVTASLVLFIAILRYSQLKPLLKKPWLNILGVVAQSFTSLGMTLVANFQLSNDAGTHNTGTVLILGFGALACWVQVILTFQTNINNEGLKAGLFRGLLATAVSLIIILYFFQVAHHKVFQGARSQWLLAMVLILFIATFSIEFRLSEFTIRCGDTRNPISSTIIAEHHSDYFQ